MRGGLDCRFDDGEVTLHEMRASADWIGFMLHRAMVAGPATKWEYCSGGMHLLSGGDLRLRPLDMAKIGLLYLHGGA